MQKIIKNRMKIALVLIGVLTVWNICTLSRNHTINVFNQVAEASTKRLLPIYSVDTKEKLISLTFDVAWGAEDVEEILDTLDKYNAKATFFIVGDWAQKYPEKVKLIAERGHDIGNHSSRHPHVTQMSKEDIKKDMMEAHEIVRRITGESMDLYRPPYGEYNNEVILAANESGYYTIQWDVDSLDWKEYGLQPMIDKVLTHKNLTYGSIVLLHNGTKHTKNALEPILKGLVDKGYTIVPISELIIKENYTIDHTGRQYKAE
ncbi:MAG: polysaccharide deacetylase family protein [Cellulosilyticaceae bacterium]